MSTYLIYGIQLNINEVVSIIVSPYHHIYSEEYDGDSVEEEDEDEVIENEDDVIENENEDDVIQSIENEDNDIALFKDFLEMNQSCDEYKFILDAINSKLNAYFGEEMVNINHIHFTLGEFPYHMYDKDDDNEEDNEDEDEDNGINNKYYIGYQYSIKHGVINHINDLIDYADDEERYDEDIIPPNTLSIHKALLKISNKTPQLIAIGDDLY